MDTQSVRDLLDRAGWQPVGLTAIGGGAWSQAWAFDHDRRRYVVRLAGNAHDFLKDRFAARFNNRRLPIPTVVEIGSARTLNAAYAISEHVAGRPLEEATSVDWQGLVPAVADLLEELRTVAGLGLNWGAWDGTGHAQHPTWSDFLSMVGEYPWHSAIPWRERLSHGELAVFNAGHRKLIDIDLGNVPRSLVHADLINRNVHVEISQITGVFDWGSALYGDHLYDLAWFLFWAPWHAELDIAALIAMTISRDARGTGGTADHTRRITACLLHIGLDHIVYNAAWGTPDGLTATIERMRELDLVR
jgi:hygromycin-B 4-O-kinase